MANEQLDKFLAEGAGDAGAQPAPASAPEPAPTAAPVESTPKADTKPEAAAKPEEKATPEPEETEPPEALAGEPVIPRRAYEDERRKRQDYKAAAARAEGELAALKKQLEDAKQAPPPPQPQPQYQPPPVPDFNQDPHGFMAAYAQQIQTRLLNDRLNTSEMFLRDKIGPEKTDEYIGEFKRLAAAEPTLYQKMYDQQNPYGWMTKEVDRQRMLRDIGDDPAAYRARIEAEGRAKWEAEQAAAGHQPAPSPAAGMQPSLATARSVAARSETWSGEPSLEELVRPIQTRKSKNGQAPRF